MTNGNWYEDQLKRRDELIHILEGKNRKLIYQLCILKGENEKLKRIKREKAGLI